MKLNIPNFETDDERAVSPVIGVILMVAITVILAAVIGAFVLNLGSSVGNTAPQASIAATDAGVVFNGNSTNDSTAMFYINHQSGGDIKYKNLKIVIQDEGGAKIATLNATSWNDSEVGINATVSGVKPSITGTFSTGDQIAINVQNNSASKFNSFSAGTTYKFIFIDTNSGQTITTAKATLQ